MSRAAVWACWLATRITGLLIVAGGFPYPTRDEILGDPAIYEEWAGVLAGGGFPEDDVRWQYPPLAVPVMLLPRWLGGDYTTTFALVALAADLVVMLLLTRARGGSLAGAWAWTAGLVLLGPMSYVRYDLIVTVAAVAALAALARHRVFGILAAVGTLLKAWPVLLLLGLPRDRRGVREVVAFAAAAGTLLAACALVLGRAPWSFLDAQTSRGLECEAVAATPFMIDRLSGWTGQIVYQYGSMELVGPGVARVADLLPLATVAALALVAVLAWRGAGRGWTAAWGCDVAFAAVLAAVATSRVLSPQYMLWLLGLGAVCLTHRASRQRPAVLMVLAAAALSQFLYPLNWQELMAADTLETWVLAVRNALVVAATVTAVARLRTGPATSAAPEPASRAPQPALG
ncbi:MAG TPA: glycosyltransferase 87 family protein [Thermomonospora sp.]|nr:glycosyltransferase 87 family protein [Thermomonospora sp.]